MDDYNEKHGLGDNYWLGFNELYKKTEKIIKENKYIFSDK